MDWLFLIAILIFSVVIHEVSHGAMANYLGDPTAKYAGRLTLNPLPHLDPLGSVLLPLFLAFIAQISGGGIIFGWAKPVPINPYNLRDKKYGSAKVALAGPGSNLSIALFFGLLLRFFSEIINLIPGLYLIFSFIVYINLLLAIFNLIPLPPLDGSHVLFSLFPNWKIRFFLEQYGMVLLLFFIFFGLRILIPIILFFYQLIIGTPLIF